MRESVLPDSNGLEDAGVAELAEDLVGVEEARRPCVVGLDAADELRRAAHHLLQELH